MDSKIINKKTNALFGVATKKEALEVIKRNIITNDRWLFRAILAVYDKQEYRERQAKSTLERNGVGFNHYDAEIMSSFAECIKKGSILSVSQVQTARHIMPKYRAQLYNIASTKIKLQEASNA